MAGNRNFFKKRCRVVVTTCMAGPGPVYRTLHTYDRANTHAWRYRIRGPHVDARAHTTRANSTPQRSGARAVQQPQRDGMADSKFEVHAIVGERFYRFRHELRVEWAEAEEGEDRHTWELASTLRAEVPDLVAAYPSLMGTRERY